MAAAARYPPNRAGPATDSEPLERPGIAEPTCGELKGAMGADTVRLGVGACRTVRPFQCGPESRCGIPRAGFMIGWLGA
jgi:hypothetical protein